MLTFLSTLLSISLSSDEVIGDSLQLVIAMHDEGDGPTLGEARSQVYNHTPTYA